MEFCSRIGIGVTILYLDQIPRTKQTLREEVCFCDEFITTMAIIVSFILKYNFLQTPFLLFNKS